MGSEEGSGPFTMIWYKGKPWIPNFIKRILETDIDRKSKGIKVFHFFFPWALYIGLASITVIGLMIARGWDTANNLLYVWIFYTIPPMGKEIIIPKVLSSDHPPPALLTALTTMMVDCVISLFLIWNYDWVKKVPYLGPKLILSEKKGQDRIKRSKWFSKASFLATTFFVFVPFQGAGGVGGTVLGRIMGLKPYKVLLAVFLGALLESFLYAYLAGTLIPIMEGSFIMEWFKNVNIFQIFIVLVMFGLLVYVVRNPREATKMTSSAMKGTLEAAKLAVIKTEKLTINTAEFTVLRSEETLQRYQLIDDEDLEKGLSIIGAPIRFLGKKGKKVDDKGEKEEIASIVMTRDKAKDLVQRGLNYSERITTNTTETAASLTVIGLELAIDGVDASEFVVLMVGDKVKGILKAPLSRILPGKKRSK
jgi:hypothetical protein